MVLKQQKNISLQRYHTMGLVATASDFIEFTDNKHLNELLSIIKAYPQHIILGGGSNTIFMGDYAGLVIHIATKGIAIEESLDKAYITVAAGENWHNFVQYTLAQGYSGLENLSLIPGTVGAAPVQNIGAYGVEVKDYITRIFTVNKYTGEEHILSNQQAGFSYRNSIFKQHIGQDLLITAVEFALAKVFKANLAYGEIASEVAKISATPSAIEVATVIRTLRQCKLPDPKILGNSGSFFHNPIVAQQQAANLRLQYPTMPYYLQHDGKVKLSAAWLIDQCGLKGLSCGQMQVYEKHALVLVNHGQGSAADLKQLIQIIQAQVLAIFAVELQAEPLLINA